MPRQVERPGANADLLVPARARARRFRLRPGRARQQVADLLVGGRGEVVVPLADRGQPGGREHADHVVGVGTNASTTGRRPRPVRRGSPAGAAGAGDLAGGSCGGTGGHSVIDDQRGASRQRDRGPVATQQVRPLGQDRLLPRLDGGQLLGAHLRVLDHAWVEDSYAALRRWRPCRAPAGRVRRAYGPRSRPVAPAVSGRPRTPREHRLVAVPAPPHPAHEDG